MDRQLVEISSDESDNVNIPTGAPTALVLPTHGDDEKIAKRVLQKATTEVSLLKKLLQAAREREKDAADNLRLIQQRQRRIGGLAAGLAAPEHQSPTRRLVTGIGASEHQSPTRRTLGGLGAGLRAPEVHHSPKIKNEPDILINEPLDITNEPEIITKPEPPALEEASWENLSFHTLDSDDRSSMIKDELILDSDEPVRRERRQTPPPLGQESIYQELQRLMVNGTRPFDMIRNLRDANKTFNNVSTKVFTRRHICDILGGGLQNTWPKPDKSIPRPFTVDQYVCVKRNLNLYLPRRPGQKGALTVSRPDQAFYNKIYPLFIASEHEAGWIYFGDYRVAANTELTLEGWNEWSDQEQIEWCKHIVSREWGKTILYQQGIITDPRENISWEKVRRHLNYADNRALHFRLQLRLLEPIKYDQKLFEALNSTPLSRKFKNSAGKKRKRATRIDTTSDDSDDFEHNGTQSIKHDSD
ncbi:hypothetical protein EDC01DRAFT_747126 [Geopyxis carbonaria]|nr:hypothetical protein EDC01DRAFT_747126 [Geopyxis carbonaria]